MSTHNQFQRQSRRTALCGLLAALSVVILLLGGIIPLATFACPVLAMICLLPVVIAYGGGTSLLVYAAVSILALLLCADKELACLYLFLGWYPTLRPRLARLSRPLQLAVKCGLFSLSMVVMYTLLLHLFQMEALLEEFQTYSTIALTGLLLFGNITFLVFDRALGILSIVFQRKLRR